MNSVSSPDNITGLSYETYITRMIRRLAESRFKGRHLQVGNADGSICRFHMQKTYSYRLDRGEWKTGLCVECLLQEGKQ